MMTEDNDTCFGCSYHDIDALWIFPIEHCYKNKQTCGGGDSMIKCQYYTESRWISFKKHFIWIFLQKW